MAGVVIQGTGSLHCSRLGALAETNAGVLLKWCLNDQHIVAGA